MANNLTLNLVKQKKKDILEVALAHGIINVRIFGSVVRDEATQHSDIDLLVDLKKGHSLLDLGGQASSLKNSSGERWI